MMKYSILIFFLLISYSLCQRTEQILVEYGQTFSLECKFDESIYFARRLGQWSDIRENADQFSSFHLKFDTLKNENIIRVSSDSAQLQHVGYYGCRKPTWSTSSMSRIYQLIIADIQSFYWTYTCHGPVGSCQRIDDPDDEKSSVFEVADQSNVDLYCCAAATGYKNVNIKMNQIGENQGQIDVKRKQELDGSWVVCATQHTLFTKKSYQNRAIFTCELTTDDQSYSTLSTAIIMKDAMPFDPDESPSSGYNPPPRDGLGEDEDYFSRQRPSSGGKRGKLSTRKKLAIILSSVFGGILLFGLLFILIFFLCCRKKASKNSTTTHTHEYAKVKTTNQPSTKENLPEQEYFYIEPVPLYENTPVIFRA